MTRLSLFAALISLAAGLAFEPTGSFAQTGAYPTKPIKLIVPFPPGGAADITARTIGQKMSETLGQPVVVENKAGANGVIGAEAVAKAAPDGYTLLLAPREVYGINPSLHAALPYDPVKGFAHIGIVTEGPYVLVVNPATGAKTMAELLALAKSKQLRFASFGIGSMAHLNLEALAQRAGIKLQHIPYKGAPAAVQAVVAGEVELAITTPPAALGFLGQGKLVAIAVGTPKRLGQLPDVPTLAEAGVQGDVLISAFFAMAAPAGSPPEVIARLSGDLKRALAAPDVAERLAKMGLVPGTGSATDMSRAVTADLAHFGALIKTLGIRLE